MRTAFLGVLTAALAVSLPAQQATEATSAKRSIDGDRIAVYRAFLKSYDNGAPGPVNLGNRTKPLDLSEGDRGNCLKGIVLDAAPSSGRALDPDVAAGLSFVLVDPERQTAAIRANDPSVKIRRGARVEDAVKSAFASGLLELSEIAFDREHRYAVLTFGFHCGALCGQGGTVVLEKADGQWKAAKRQCSFWMS
jgi:hypothetical protein